MHLSVCHLMDTGKKHTANSTSNSAIWLSKIPHDPVLSPSPSMPGCSRVLNLFAQVLSELSWNTWVELIIADTVDWSKSNGTESPWVAKTSSSVVTSCQSEFPGAFKGIDTILYGAAEVSEGVDSFSIKRPALTLMPAVRQMSSNSGLYECARSTGRPQSFHAQGKLTCTQNVFQKCSCLV